MFQLGSGLLDGCVLAVLEREDAYGYSLTQNIKKVIPVSESTLYPVLRRLQSEQLLTTYDQPHSGRNRRYYRITDGGQARLKETQAAWTHFKKGVDTLLVTGEENMSKALATGEQVTELAKHSANKETDNNTNIDTQEGGDEQ